jgi:predicted RNase H-like HicB family nuclease
LNATLKIQNQGILEVIEEVKEDLIEKNNPIDKNDFTIRIYSENSSNEW